MLRFENYIPASKAKRKENNHAKNKRFQFPLISTANQRYGQNLATVSTNVREFVSGPVLAVAVRENV